MRVALIQSNYIPWKGYFDIIHDVETFVFHDDLQYTKGDWRNRNRIKTAAGDRWLTIPVGTNEHRRICDVRLPGGGWAREHWRQIREAYALAPFFATYRPYFEDLYLGRQWAGLSELNQAFIAGISRDLLGITTAFRRSEEFVLTQAKGARVIELLTAIGATEYVSGPAAREYITDETFAAAGIRVTWKDYQGYPRYSQRFEPFSHAVSVLDLIFNVGPDAPWYIWGWRSATKSGAAA